MKRFLLLNKDVVVLEFSAVEKNCRIEYKICSIERKDLIPRDLRCIDDWVDSRYVLSERRSLGRIMRFAGVNSFIDFLEITNGVSLKDTYWVKEVNSEKSWSMVSTYSNSLNRLMSDYAFNRGLTGKTVYGSPEFATDGNFEKCWRKYNGGIYLYKRGSSGGCNVGNEPYSEVYAYKIAKAIGIDCCEYKLGIYKGITTSICKCMTNEKVGLMSYRDLTGEVECNFEKLITSIDGQNKKYIVDMLLLDYVICNVDRDYENIGVLLDNDTNGIIGFTPLYDHNLSCIPYYTDEESLDYYISSIRAKDGRSWEELYRLIDSKYSRNKLSMLLGNSFSIGCKRDKIVNEMVKHQIEKVLCR